MKDARLNAAKLGGVHVVLASLIFPPDGVSSAQLLGEIVEDLAIAGACITVITTRPHYNVDSTARASQPISRRRFSLFATSEYCGARVLHIPMGNKAPSAAGRLLQWCWYSLALLVCLLFEARDGDVYISASPPPTTSCVVGWMGRWRRKGHLALVWELYPEVAARLGYLQADGRSYRALKMLQRSTYANSARTVVLHEAMVNSVLETFPAARVEVIPTFVDTGIFHPMPKHSDNGSSQVTLGYAGNLGESEDLVPVVRAISVMESTSMRLLVVGDGTDRARLEALANRLAPTAVEFTGHLPYSEMPQVLSSFDIGLVTLANAIAAEALPSKVYKLMAVGVPILAVCGSDSPLADLVTTTSSGICCRPEPEAIAEAAAILCDEKLRRRLGANGRQAALDRFSRASASRRLCELVSDLADSP